jgi:hypothetical protein
MKVSKETSAKHRDELLNAGARAGLKAELARLRRGLSEPQTRAQSGDCATPSPHTGHTRSKNLPTSGN